MQEPFFTTWVKYYSLENAIHIIRNSQSTEVIRNETWDLIFSTYLIIIKIFIFVELRETNSSINSTFIYQKWYERNDTQDRNNDGRDKWRKKKKNLCKFSQLFCSY